ncbi:hypothetical protein IEQ34_015579 [Dendrobium chrysotoxum]|uniref:Uncharacterized protein n=1 Tax=Dendrobium chrysotoxum TaxID=161865 RepID=A0AAV7GH36_DENCH|nr:hypothetical protein IEQ34_015579 [Dendrobium chrysotoxum]
MGKLIFSLSDNMNLAYNPFADGSLSVSGPEFTVVPPTEITNQKPILEFTLGCGSQIALVAPRHSDQKLKSVVVADSAVPFSAASQFEIGSSSNMSTIMTKTQRKNKNHCTKRRMEKLGLSSKNEQAPLTSPHLSGSRFHLLSAADGEEDVRKIARSALTVVGKSTTEPVKDKEVHIQNMIRAIVQEYTDNHFQTKEGFLRNMKRMINERIEEETSSQKSTRTLVVGQSRARDSKRKFKPVVISTLTNGYPREPRRSHRKIDRRLESSNQPSPTSDEKKVWRPKEKVVSPVAASPKRPIESEPEKEERVETNPPNHMDCERYVPVDHHYIS